MRPLFQLQQWGERILGAPDRDLLRFPNRDSLPGPPPARTRNLLLCGPGRTKLPDSNLVPSSTLSGGRRKRRFSREARKKKSNFRPFHFTGPSFRRGGAGSSEFSSGGVASGERRRRRSFADASPASAWGCEGSDLERGFQEQLRCLLGAAGAIAVA